MQEARPAKPLWRLIDDSHQNKWVAIARDYSRVVSMASTLGELVQMVGDQDVVFHRVLPKNVSFAPSAF